MTDLYHEIKSVKAMAEAIRREFPDIPDEELAQVIEGETSISNAIASLLRMAEDTQVFSNALNVRIGQMVDRMKRMDDRVARLRTLAQGAMEACGIKKLEREDFTASLQASRPKVIITDMTKLTEDYLVWSDPRPNKEKIGEALKAGERVEGAEFSNPGTHLTIRRG